MGEAHDRCPERRPGRSHAGSHRHRPPVGVPSPMTRIACVNGRFLPEADATVSIFDRGFLFADGVYEVIAVVDGCLVDDGPHLDRLDRSLHEIALPLPMPRATLHAQLRSLVERNGIAEGLVYLQVTRGPAERDFAFPAAPQPTVVAWARPLAVLEHPRAAAGATAVTVPDQRWARRDIKSIALLPQVLAKQAARAAGAFEALMVEDGRLTEGGAATLFALIDGALVTHALGHEVLPGITRERVLALAAAQRLPVIERSITTVELLAASELFITAATAFVMPIVQVDGRDIGTGAPGPVTVRMRAGYIAAVRHGAAASP
ncbi:MAG: D-amino-acid transaminase [Gemmatimonadaceae bacterium]|nr:D-amino-acid transaminase [Gemmatimonadaceae bacterium]